MIQKFRKKPIMIEAEQYTGENNPFGVIKRHGFNEDMQPNARYSAPAIETLEGWHQVKINDWVIKGIKGEFYPCKPDIFEKTYELVK